MHSVHKSVKKTLFNPRTSQFGEVETEVEQTFCYNPFIDEAPHRASFFCPYAQQVGAHERMLFSQAKNKKRIYPEAGYILFIVVNRSEKRLHLDFYFNTARQFELHEGIDGLGVGAIDVDETLVGRNLKLLTALLVDEGRAVHRDDALTSGEGDGTAHDGTRCFDILHDFFGRLLNESVVVALELDTNFLTHCFVVFDTIERWAG